MDETFDWRQVGRVHEDAKGKEWCWIHVRCESVDVPGLVLAVFPDHLSLTHLATGLCIGRFKDREASLRAAHARSTLADWEQDRPIPDQAMGKAVKAAVQAAGGT